MKYILSLVALFSIVYISCAKNEEIILHSEPLAPELLDYSNAENGSNWKYDCNYNYADFEFQHGGTKDSLGYYPIGSRRRSISLYGGSSILESFSYKETDSIMSFNISESYNYLVLLKLIPYSLNFKKFAKVGDTWAETKTLTYTRYDQVSDQFITPHTYYVTYEYSVIDSPTEIDIQGIEINQTITYKIDYEIAGKYFSRTFTFADKVGLIHFTDDDSYYSQLTSYH